MEDTTISIVGFTIAAILMFIVPLMLMADRTDDITQLVAQTTTSEFVNDVIKDGKITLERYERFLRELSSTGNTYEVNMEIKIVDKNTIKIGNNYTNYSIFTSQIEDIMSRDGLIILKQGDSIHVTAQNSSKTFSQSLKSFYYRTKDSNLQIITATASGTITINGIK